MHVQIKICGVTTVEDAVLAAQLGADAIGLNFFPGSPRFVTMDRAQAIVRRLPPFVEPVALFVNESWSAIRDVLKSIPLIRTVQWHGEQPEPCPFDQFRFIPAFPVRDEGSLAVIDQFLQDCRKESHMPSAVLVDGHAKGKYGGTGKRAPWEILADYEPGVPLILAGGLNPDNVAEAVRVVGPYAVDVAGGVECEPGRKDAELVRRFIENANCGS